MPFPSLQEGVAEAMLSTETVMGWLGIFSNIGLVAFLCLLVKWFWNRRRWRRFESSIRAWAQETFDLDLEENEWKSLVAIKLSDAEFSPKEILQLLDLGVLVAKGRAALENREEV